MLLGSSALSCSITTLEIAKLMTLLDRNSASKVKPEPSKPKGIVKNEPMEEGNDDSELTVKAELDEVKDEADLDAELDALDAAQGVVKVEDHTA